MELLILFIFNTFTLAMSNHIKLIPGLCIAGITPVFTAPNLPQEIFT